MEPLQDNPQESRVYRYSISGWLGTLAQSALLVYMGYIWLTQGPDGPTIYAPLNWLVGAVLILGIILLVSNAASSMVVFSRESVTVRGLFQTNSIRRASVKGYENAQSGRRSYIRLLSNSSEESDLQIAKSYAFDDEWKRWISGFPDPDIANEARFTLK